MDESKAQGIVESCGSQLISYSGTAARLALASEEEVIISIGVGTAKVIIPPQGFLESLFPKVIVSRNISDWDLLGGFLGKDSLTKSMLLGGLLVSVACCDSTTELRQRWNEFPNPMGVYTFLMEKEFIVEPGSPLKWVLFGQSNT